MAKVSGSYESVVRGVSEQVPQDRRSGQHYEQVNLVSDPVRGLARRHGSLMQAEQIIAPYTAPFYSDLLANTAKHKVVTFYVDDVEYDLIYRPTALIGTELGEYSFAWCFNKEAREFIPVTLNPSDPVLDQLIAGGVSAAVGVGKFLLLAGNTSRPVASVTNTHAQNAEKAVVWVRGGAYSRTFKVEVVFASGVRVTASYKTVSSSYPGLLDTSDLLTADLDYQKKVNDRTNAYNSEVTKWIGTAAEDITPENIAEKLRLALVAQGVVGVGTQGGTLVFNGEAIKEINADDSGDGTLLRAVANQVASPEMVSTIHWPGKVVRVRPSRGGSDDSFYLKAYAKDEAATGWTEVTWREAAGVTMQPTSVFVLGSIHNGTLYLSSNSAWLATQIADAVPAYKASAVGDDVTSPLPQFFGKKISYLGLFQDRLVVGTGAVLTFSRPGDYFNWFRQSMLTVLDTDPWEGFALGAEEDTITSSVSYDKNLLLYGKKFQYGLSGRQQLTPKQNPIIAVVASFKDASDAPPQGAGNLVFFTKHSGEPGLEASSLHQLQPSAVAENPDPVDASQQLDRYLTGKPVQIVTMTKPNMVALRTDALRTSVFTYTYLDSASERLFDSWSRWTWEPKLGAAVGMSTQDTGLLIYMVRTGKDRDGLPQVWIAAERFVRDTALSNYPYADSLRPLTNVQAPSADAFINPASELSAEGCVAFKGSSQYRFLGSPLAGLATFTATYPADLADAWVGVQYPASFTPTNPYIRDRNDRAILDGRLTLGRVRIAVADTGGCVITVKTAAGTKVALDFNGRILGQNGNLVGRQPIVTTAVSASIGKEVRECTFTVAAKAWLPLTVTAIGWVGQYFNNTRRVG